MACVLVDIDRLAIGGMSCLSCMYSHDHTSWGVLICRFQHAKETRHQGEGCSGNFGLQCDISALQEAIANRLVLWFHSSLIGRAGRAIKL